MLSGWKKRPQVWISKKKKKNRRRYFCIYLAFKIASADKGIDKFKIIGDLALTTGEIELSIRCYERINDLNGLLLVYSSLSLPKQLAELGEKAERLCKMNVAFQCYFMTNQPEKCFNVLVKSKRFSEAALFARTYIPEKITEAV